VNDETLQTLLRQADASAGPGPCEAPDLAQRVRRRAQRRRIMRNATLASTAAAALAVSIGLPLVRQPRMTPVNPAATLSPQEIEMELASLRAEIASREAFVERLLANEKQAETHQRLLAAEKAVPREGLSERDQAGKILIRQAHEWRVTDGRRAEALEAYRRVIQLFPDSPWANVAREQIRMLQNQSPGKETGHEELHRNDMLLCRVAGCDGRLECPDGGGSSRHGATRPGSGSI
jgi:hypothetical protein